MSSKESTRADGNRLTKQSIENPTQGVKIPPSELDQTQSIDPTPYSPSFFEFSADESSPFDHGDFEVFDLNSLPITFANYTLIEKIGEGGAGIVFRATPNEKSSPAGEFEAIALKMIRPEIVASNQAVRRFEKESRLHSEIDNPYVTKHLGFGSERGIYYIASEFIEGFPLDKIVKRLEKLPVKSSLRIAADLLKALDALHNAGVIHRDVKPANIIASFRNASGTDSDEELGDFVIAKLTDFGLARHIEQSESLAMTRQQTLLGTPLYMAPEQHFESRAVDARADIYSAGVTLYQMLAGYPPFEAEEHVDLAEMHRTEHPIPLTIARPGTSEAVCNVVMKALEKDPNLRYQHAQEMLADIERILNDQPVALRMYPETPDALDASVKSYDFHWTLDAQTKQLWPLVSDTDRFNQAIGLPAPNFNYDHSGDQLKISADVKFNGIKIHWRERPFQWICEREMSILREFETGPFEWVSSTIELQPLVGGKTRLIHRIQVKPRGWLGKLVTPVQFGVLTKRSLDKVYSRLAKIANDTSCGFACDLSFGAEPKLTKTQSACLDERTTRLGQMIKNAPLARQLGEFIRRVADPMAVRVRPLELAARLDCHDDQALQACFTSVEVGLLNLSWDIICPVCRIAADNISTLAKIETHTHCKVCNIDFEADFAQSVEAIFSVHPEIRQVEIKTYCIGGPFHAPHVLAQNRLLVGQHVDVGVVLNPGRYAVTGPQLDRQGEIEVEADAVVHRAEYVIGGDTPQSLPTFCSGYACVKIENQSDVEVLVRLEQKTKREKTLTANLACQHPLFKKLFPTDVKTAQQLVGVANLYLLAIRHTEADDLIDQVGDVQVRESWNQLQSLFPVDDAGCRIVECNHESLIVSFSLLEDLFTTLSTVLADVGSEAGKFSIPIDECCFTVQAGEVMTGSAENQPATFGKTVRDTRKLLSKLAAGEFLFPSDVYDKLMNRSTTSGAGPSGITATGPVLSQCFELIDETPDQSSVKMVLRRRT